jgi:hypothetical protein
MTTLFRGVSLDLTAVERAGGLTALPNPRFPAGSRTHVHEDGGWISPPPLRSSK